VLFQARSLTWSSSSTDRGRRPQGARLGPDERELREKSKAKRVCLGVVLGAHGVRGELRIRSYTEDPRAIVAYGPLEDESGRLLPDDPTPGNGGQVAR